MLGIEHGGIAQLGERLNGIQEVSGSIPLISTTNMGTMLGKRLQIERFEVFFVTFVAIRSMPYQAVSHLSNTLSNKIRRF